VTKQIVLTSHLVDLNYIAFSKKLWDDLPADQQAAVQAAADSAAEFGRQNQLKKEEELVAFLKEKGLDIYEPDLSAFRNQVQSMYLKSDLAEAWPEGVLKKINGLGG
jgi:TRAP-type C4-dicarboxylate transport system substrate-binding protein